MRGESVFDIAIDFYGDMRDDRISAVLQEVKGNSANVLVLDQKLVPWFPLHVSELDAIATRTLDAGAELKSDHPGFHDATYRQRRQMIASLANQHKHGSLPPLLEYTEEEIATWRTVYDNLEPMTNKFACRQYLDIVAEMRSEGVVTRDRIPQQRDVSAFLEEKTGFTVRPVAGLLSSRDFLNGLAFRTFFSTQYMRHHSLPLYTPEPDLCHEIIGHAPMFADPDFADFSQAIGLASLGASEEDVKRLATCYWFSVEFGLCREEGEVKAYGAGLLSSFGELEYACSPTRPAGGKLEAPAIEAWDPWVAAHRSYPITEYQPTYFCAESLQEAKERMRDFCEQGLKRPFHARFHELSQSVWVDRNVARSPP
ncbi:hypothetical protein GUITHDRAFT_157502 [Guillardia theta CCMP2712]|uniref:phenylalanine 4-monooxygenase n=1 Tax=Guillardia theta (strain CCMP2712) TaxID=905079 RepID=L1JJA2_GUITC|nr:hypothetical protein GUITHDRAFT_157502 [Guillardia theta CCMP2712]EKX48603.1 hypothetical protein GUITHDRAFT_157502 [Guillardia theta CCMP2712]|eukprot:XP_005835583.1 hypothetical protein GUITHDRAFT_157502 [Guillardia theta CCMP2712]